MHFLPSQSNLIVFAAFLKVNCSNSGQKIEACQAVVQRSCLDSCYLGNKCW